MDDAVGRLDISGDDSGTVQHDLAAHDLHGDRTTEDGRDLGHLHHCIAVRGHAGNDVESQDLDELLLVLRLEEHLERARGELREGRIGRSEDRERTLARERLDEASGLDRGDERVERAVLHGHINHGAVDRQDDGVDHMDDAVRARDVGGSHGRAVDGDLRAVDLDVDALAVDGARVLQLDDIGGLHGARDHVVGQDRGKLRLVLRLQEHLEGAGRELGERRVGRREHGERTLAVERVDQARRLHGRHEGLEVAGSDRGFDNRRLRGGVGAGWGLRGRVLESERRGSEKERDGKRDQHVFPTKVQQCERYSRAVDRTGSSHQVPKRFSTRDTPRRGVRATTARRIHAGR